MESKLPEKSWKLRFLEKRLFVISRRIIEKYNPRIITITGSVGKTSTRLAIHTVMNVKHDCRQSQENQNNEVGVPLTIIGVGAPSSALGWLGVLWAGWKQVWFQNRRYPEMLIIELGIDRPGDMDYLMKIVQPHIGVVTAIGVSHLEFFGDQKTLTKEKRKMVAAIQEGGHAILNADNDLARQSSSMTQAPSITYGFRSDADLVASDVVSSSRRMNGSEEEQMLADAGFPLGVSFKVQYQGKNVPFYLHRVVGKHQILPVLPAIVCGVLFGMNLVEISEALATYVPAKGRMNLIAGIKNSLIIDDTYNSAPESTLAALKVLREMGGSGKKRAVLGDMLELGPETEARHREVGAYAAEFLDELVVFGPRGVFTADEAVKRGMSKEDIHVVEKDHREVEKILQPHIASGDALLVKASQGMRLEHVVKMLMANPERAEELLVRQTKVWLDKPYEPESVM